MEEFEGFEGELADIYRGDLKQSAQQMLAYNYTKFLEQPNGFVAIHEITRRISVFHL